MAMEVCYINSHFRDRRTDLSVPAIKTQLYSIPPWVVSWGLSNIIAYLSDRFRHRFVFAIGPLFLALAGFGMLLNLHGKAHRDAEYAALFLAAAGTYAALPIMVCWFTMNTSGHLRRSVGTAWQVGFGNIGGFISTYAFLQKDAPEYRPGYSICLGFICLGFASTLLYLAAVWFDNMRRNRAVAVMSENESIGEGDTEVLGDMAPTYRYQF